MGSQVQGLWPGSHRPRLLTRMSHEGNTQIHTDKNTGTRQRHDAHTVDTHRHTPEETYMDTEDRHKEIKTHRDTIRNTQRGRKFTHTTNTDTCKSNTHSP